MTMLGTIRTLKALALTQPRQTLPREDMSAGDHHRGVRVGGLFL